MDARLDLPATGQWHDWPEWMTREIRDADRLLVIASSQDQRRGEGDAGPAEGRGVQFEVPLIRERFHTNRQAGLSTAAKITSVHSGR